MSQKIPTAVIAVVSDALANKYSHAAIDQMMEAAGIELEPSPPGNKQVKTRAWLNHANNTSAEPLTTLGQVITELMEAHNDWKSAYETDLQKVHNKLREYGLSYMKGGHIATLGATTVSRTVKEIAQSRDLTGLQTEFVRINENLEADPPAAVTAACALLESLFKTYIEENNLEMPSDQTVKPLWKIVKKDLKLDPVMVDDDDLRTILTGLAALVEGIGSLRTHEGSAHGRSKKYKLKPRHARLAAHAAFTLASFVLEAWEGRG